MVRIVDILMVTFCFLCSQTWSQKIHKFISDDRGLDEPTILTEPQDRDSMAMAMAPMRYTPNEEVIFVPFPEIGEQFIERRIPNSRLHQVIVDVTSFTQVKDKITEASTKMDTILARIGENENAIKQIQSENQEARAREQQHVNDVLAKLVEKDSSIQKIHVDMQGSLAKEQKDIDSLVSRLLEGENKIQQVQAELKEVTVHGKKDVDEIFARFSHYDEMILRIQSDMKDAMAKEQKEIDKEFLANQFKMKDVERKVENLEINISNVKELLTRDLNLLQTLFKSAGKSSEGSDTRKCKKSKKDKVDDGNADNSSSSEEDEKDNPKDVVVRVL